MEQSILLDSLWNSPIVWYLLKVIPIAPLLFFNEVLDEVILPWLSSSSGRLELQWYDWIQAAYTENTKILNCLLLFAILPFILNAAFWYLNLDCYYDKVYIFNPFYFVLSGLCVYALPVDSYIFPSHIFDIWIYELMELPIIILVPQFFILCLSMAPIIHADKVMFVPYLIFICLILFGLYKRLNLYVDYSTVNEYKKFLLREVLRYVIYGAGYVYAEGSTLYDLYSRSIIPCSDIVGVVDDLNSHVEKDSLDVSKSGVYKSLGFSQVESYANGSTNVNCFFSPVIGSLLVFGLSFLT